MKKKDREIIYNKYGGRCAYCGDILQKGWHVDELLPCRRKQKWIPGNWEGDPTCENVVYKEGRWVSDGYEHPERLHIDNQMPACASCNINKHSMELEDFRKLIQGFMKHLNEVNVQYKVAKRYGLITETPKPVIFYFETINSKRHE